MKRNKAPFIDFETGYPKKPPKTPTVFTAFTLSKQRKIEKLLEETPQVTFRGRVHGGLSCRWLVKHSGRNETGRVTTRHRGGGHMQRLRFIDFKRGRKDVPATVLTCRICSWQDSTHSTDTVRWRCAKLHSRPAYAKTWRLSSRVYRRKYATRKLLTPRENTARHYRTQYRITSRRRWTMPPKKTCFLLSSSFFFFLLSTRWKEE